SGEPTPRVVTLRALFLTFNWNFLIFNCSGHVWIEPAPVVPMGSNISINCFSTLGCSRAKLFILLNYNRLEGPLRPLNSSAVQLRLPDFRMPLGTILCLAQCPNSQETSLVCGTDVLAGYPPDPPSNLSCTIGEGSGRLACTWDAGRPTHLSTHYTLHLRSMGMAADAEDEEEEEVFPVDSPVLLSTLRGGNHYWAWVQANNTLGTARSATQLVPALPLVAGAETMEVRPPVTTVRWRRQTLLENLHCEERHKATGAPEWHVEVWDSTGQDGPLSRHNLQSDTQYVFQVRCRLSPTNSPWSSWSTPFLYTTPEAGEPRCIFFPTQPIGSLRCFMGTWVLAGQAKGSQQHACDGHTLCLLLPGENFTQHELIKWTNILGFILSFCNVVKSLQEKSHFTSNSFHEPFLDTSDPTLTEIEEVPAHEEYKNVATRRKPSREVPEDGERPGNTVPTSIMAPVQISDYKPQVSDGNQLGYVAANFYQPQPPIDLPEPETNIFFRDYTSPIAHLWDGEGGGHQVCLLEKINLILNTSRSGQSQAFSSAQGGHGSLLENPWGHALASDVQEQTLVPDELVSCLRAMNRESGDGNACFPQKSHHTRV
uniref:Interleukin 23 receptor n=1 Tax=Calidris pygmaea TaxID=425635 RepID=A0A8C3J2H7_9CHAR